MHLNHHSLQQIDAAYIQSLEPEALRNLSVRLLADLKEAWDRLNQGPDNSSRPPSRRAPWERTGCGSASAEDAAAGELMPNSAEAKPVDVQPVEGKPVEAQPAEGKPVDMQPVDSPPKRKPGKQPGAPGFGRTQLFHAHEEQGHYPPACAGCGQPLVGAPTVAYTGFQAVDLRLGEPGQPGLTLWVVDHRYYEAACGCGHRTRAVAAQGEVDPLLAGIELSEWRLVGPELAALIVALAQRFRLSRARIREFLGEWLGLDLSIGTIHQTIHEAGAVVAPAEAELIEAVLASDLLHADETSWPEHGRPLWLWVFHSLTVTLYYVAGRGRERVDNVLDGFSGWLMSDGWIAYRHYPRRLRRWAHLLRKARGLAQSCDREARCFGRQVLKTLETLMASVYAAREGPPAVDLPTQHAPALAELRAACERYRGSDHGKTHALAVELLNGDIIGSVYEFNNYRAKDFQPLFHPQAHFTDDAVCTAAIADTLLHERDPTQTLQDWCQRYWHNGGWGQKFIRWIATEMPAPYGSYGNGAAMRVSAAGFLADSLDAAFRVTATGGSSAATTG